MKKNSKKVISVISGIIMYLIGFFWISEMGRIIMGLGVMVLGINLFLFGRKIKNSNKIIGYFCIYGSVVWLFAVLFFTVISIFINYQ